jgi:hypothetical protein
VPVTPVYEDDTAILGHNDVGFARQVFAVQPKSISHPVQQRPDGLFRLRILRPNPAHVPTSAFFGKLIGHATVICSWRMKLTKPSKSRIRSRYGLGNEVIRGRGTTKHTSLSYISRICPSDTPSCRVKRCFGLILFASFKICRHRSLQHVFAPSMCSR